MNVKEGQGVKEERPIHRLYLGHQCLILFVLLPKGWLYSNQPTLLNDPNKYYFPIDKASRNTCLLLFFHSLYAEWGAESASETLTQKRRTDTDTRKQSQNTLLSSPTPNRGNTENPTRPNALHTIILQSTVIHRGLKGVQVRLVQGYAGACTFFTSLKSRLCIVILISTNALNSFLAFPVSLQQHPLLQCPLQWRPTYRLLSFQSSGN